MEATDDRELLSDQQALAASLQQLGAMLQNCSAVDPSAATEVVVEAVAGVRRWLESGVAVEAIDLATREQLAIWESELLDGALRIGALGMLIRHDLDDADDQGAGRPVSMIHRPAK